MVWAIWGNVARCGVRSKGIQAARVPKCLKREGSPKEGIGGDHKKERNGENERCPLYCSTANPGHVQIIQEQEKGDGREEEQRALDEARNVEGGRKVDRA